MRTIPAPLSTWPNKRVTPVLLTSPTNSITGAPGTAFHPQWLLDLSPQLKLKEF